MNFKPNSNQKTKQNKTLFHTIIVQMLAIRPKAKILAKTSEAEHTSRVFTWYLGR
jgi:hypothetical protein